MRLNGRDLGVVWDKPARVDITSAAKAGENDLEITVVNLWPNRLKGDESLPKEKRLTETNIHKFTAAFAAVAVRVDRAGERANGGISMRMETKNRSRLARFVAIWLSGMLTLFVLNDAKPQLTILGCPLHTAIQ